MRLRLPKNRRHRIYLYLLPLLVILTALDILLVHLRRHITVAPDTTRITTPLRPDGTPDYLQALEARASAGITPDNNAAVPLVALLDPATPDLPPTLFTALHLQPPTASRPDSFQTFSLFYQRQYPGSPPIDIETKILKAALADAPFTRPDAAAWTDANADALDALHTITRLPHYHIPYTCDPANDLLINIQLPELHPFRQMGHALVLRARLRIDAGQLDDAAEDLAAAHRLAASSATAAKPPSNASPPSPSTPRLPNSMDTSSPAPPSSPNKPHASPPPSTPSHPSPLSSAPSTPPNAGA